MQAAYRSEEMTRSSIVGRPSILRLCGVRVGLGLGGKRRERGEREKRAGEQRRERRGER